jgi:sodium-coupled neutral amino acid transporter 11
MAKARSYDGQRDTGAASASTEEDIGLLSADADLEDAAHHAGDEDDDDDIIVHSGGPSDVAAGSGALTPRTPRTPNRVRFDLTPTIANIPRHSQDGSNGSATPPNSGTGSPYEAFDVSEDTDDDDDNAGYAPSAGGAAHRTPLLTDIEAPSVTLANSPWAGEGGVEAWAEAERRRPKSGLRSAFMNMANSIIGAGIIGQPYALRQAGLLAGVVLLVALTAVVDWTIRLIVVNSKLSGASSFQGTVERCFGRSGLIAISVAQWAFAFGGMVAFGVIVGDSIPHVLVAIWPGLRQEPVLGLLADRRAVIVVFLLGVSYPLTLYRDIAKVRKAPEGSYCLRREVQQDG